MKALLLAAALGLVPVASMPTAPEGLSVTPIPTARLCQAGVCVVPEDLFMGLIGANNRLGAALAEQMQDKRDLIAALEEAQKTKRCATVIPIPKGKAT